MGNIQKKISSAKSIQELGTFLKHIQETRPQSEIEITNRLTHLLSDLNTTRVGKFKHISASSKDWSDYVFVCVQGFPAIKDEFSVLSLPGETTYFAALLFSEEGDKLSDEQKFKAASESTFKLEADRLHLKLKSIPENKKIIFVYHSAGNFIMSMYFFYYGYKWLGSRVKGMIDVAGGPLRYYLSSQMLVPVIYDTDFKQILDNADKVHEFFVTSLSSMGFDLGFKNKYQTLSFLRLVKSPDYGELFETTRHHPEVLKLIIHGRKDTLFDSTLLNEKAIYFSMLRELEQGYNQELVKKYIQMYGPPKEGVKLQNIQERFIFAIPRGQHSVHTQPRNHELIREAVQQYLCLIHE